VNFLLLYNATQTHTNTVFEHLEAFSRFSAHRYFFCHHDREQPFNVDLALFDGVGIHYSTRLAYDQVSDAAAVRLAAYAGLKFLYIQDEYEHTHRAWQWIQRLGMRLVFTVVPEASIARVYPPERFPSVRFVSNLTGYVPEKLPSVDKLEPPSRRARLIGYRGRPLPLLRFGALGQEKVDIGRVVKAYCAERNIAHDIAWSEEARIYGARWYEFMASCRAMLGSESGANVFDWDGSLDRRVADYRARHPQASEQQVYRDVIAPLEQPGLMNQVSPRVFEAISLRTVLVLFEGHYSGVIEPWKHYIPLKKDGSNLDAVFAALADARLVDEMSERAWQDVVGSGRYGYPAFVKMTDAEMERAAAQCPAAARGAISATVAEAPTDCTTHPARAAPPAFGLHSPQWSVAMLHMKLALVALWRALPPPLSRALRPLVHGFLLPTYRRVRDVVRSSHG
jgi:hypothetical protein